MKGPKEEALKAAVAKAQAELDALKADPVLSERLEVAWHAVNDAEEAERIAIKERTEARQKVLDRWGFYASKLVYSQAFKDALAKAVGCDWERIEELRPYAAVGYIDRVVAADPAFAEADAKATRAFAAFLDTKKVCRALHAPIERAEDTLRVAWAMLNDYMERKEGAMSSKAGSDRRNKKLLEARAKIDAIVAGTLELDFKPRE